MRRRVTVDSALAEQGMAEEGVAAEAYLAEQRDLAWGRRRAEGRMALAASGRRLGKEIRAYAKLDEINRRWEQRGKP